MPSYVRILRQGRVHTRLLLGDGNTAIIRTEDLPCWDCVYPQQAPIPDPCTEPYIQPALQEDRIYRSLIRRGSRHVSVSLSDGSIIRIPTVYFSAWLKEDSPEYRSWVERTRYAQGRSIEDLTFGVELEFIASERNYARFVESMSNIVGTQRFSDPMTYGISDPSKWILGYDSSVKPTVQADSSKKGYELTSPILHFNDVCKEELSKVLSAIELVFNGKVNKTCGTHIHIGNFACIENTSAFRQKCVSFQVTYGKLENKVFDVLTSPSRRGNSCHYCKTCNVSEGTYEYYNLKNRYHKMNTEHLFGFGTLENRQHQGTLEIQKIWSWMELNGRFVLDWFKDPSSYANLPDSLEDFLAKICISEEAKIFLLLRRDHFSRG